MTFDYELPVELFTAKRGARSRLGYRRFATAAEASIVVGDFPALRTLGADARYDGEDIRRLYGNSDYPLRRRTCGR